MSTVLIDRFSTRHNLKFEALVGALFISLLIRYHHYYNDITLLMAKVKSLYIEYFSFLKAIFLKYFFMQFCNVLRADGELI